MAKEYVFQIPTHNSVYIENYEKGNYENREIRVNYCLPEKGVNTETGVLLLICGYGATIDSNVYIKMRRNFSDHYNLITIQCDYFGSKYMHSNFSDSFKNQEELRRCFAENLTTAQISFGEELNDFNDMGIMQAIDNIVSTITVLGTLKQQGLVFNTNKVMIYGHSQGGYLAFLCNRFAPGLYNLIIDNSAWNVPKYLDESRLVLLRVEPFGDLTLDIEYLIAKDKSLRISTSIYDLNFLYKDYINTCQVISCHGVDDELVRIEDKRMLLKDIENMMLIEIEKEDVDGILFGSSEHGLGADFLKLFDLIYSEYTPIYLADFDFKKPDNVIIDLENGRIIEINYDNLFPNILLR
jgi:hypothetical protein